MSIFIALLGAVGTFIGIAFIGVLVTMVTSREPVILAFISLVVWIVGPWVSTRVFRKIRRSNSA